MSIVRAFSESAVESKRISRKVAKDAKFGVNVEFQYYFLCDFASLRETSFDGH
jgi:hypothetical protein